MRADIDDQLITLRAEFLSAVTRCLLGKISPHPLSVAVWKFLFNRLLVRRWYCGVVLCGDEDC